MHTSHLTFSSYTLDLFKHYFDLNTKINSCNNEFACTIISENTDNFDKEGCETDLDSMMKEGVIQVVSLMLAHTYELYYAYINEKDIKQVPVYMKYLDDFVFHNQCILLKTRS